jgi:hypothetical protein
MLGRVRCILYVGVERLTGLTPAQCQQPRDQR